MHYFFGQVTTQYMDMEWTQSFVISARSAQSAQRKADKQDWTHGDGIERQKAACSLREITEEHYNVLKEYILNANDISIL